MAIFTNTVLEESNVELEMDIPGVEPTIECAQNILYEFNKGVTDTLAATYVADIMLESAVSEGAENVEELVEGAVGDALNKAANYFKDFMTKIAVWFKRIILSLTDHTKKISKYATKYKSDIEKNFENANADKKSIENPYLTKNVLNIGFDLFQDIFVTVNNARSIMDPEKVKAMPITGKEYTAGLEGKKNNNTLIDTLKGQIYKAEGADKKETLSDIGNYITDCVKSPEQLKRIKDYQDSTEKMLKNIIADIKKMESGDQKTEFMSKIDFYKRAVTGAQNVFTFVIGAFQKEVNFKFNVIKRFVKGAEDVKVEDPKTEVEKESSVGSIFESALSLV